MKNHSVQFRLWWTPFEIKLCTIEIISKYCIVWYNTGPNFIYFSTSSCLSLGQIELIKYLQFSFTLASSNSVIINHKPFFDKRVLVTWCTVYSICTHPRTCCVCIRTHTVCMKVYWYFPNASWDQYDVPRYSEGIYGGKSEVCLYL